MDLNQEELLDYYELGAELDKVKAAAGAAEAHGILIGQLCGGIKDQGEIWLKQYLLALGVNHEPWKATRDYFLQFRQSYLNILNSTDFDFTPLLPDDDEPLEDRLNGLSEWCSGFLAGFGIAGVGDEAAFSDDTRTALRDIKEISRVDPGVDSDVDEGDETAFFEVVEYIRVAAMMLFSEFALKKEQLPAGAPDGEGNESTLH